MSTSTIRWTFAVDGVFTNVTSATLSDSTGTYGVRRTDTQASVVDDGTAMTNAATGVYEHSFTDPDSDLTYEYVVEWVYAGITHYTTLFHPDTTKVVSVEEMKTHLHIDSDEDSEDETLDAMIDAATKWCEEFQGRKYLTQTIVEKFDGFPTEFHTTWSPLIAVASITYTDTAGDTQTLSSTYYTVDADSEPGRIVEAYGYSWPAARDHVNVVTLTYTAGYGDAAAVPVRVKQAVKLLVGHWYLNREAASQTDLASIPNGVESLLWQDRLIRI